MNRGSPTLEFLFDSPTKICVSKPYRRRPRNRKRIWSCAWQTSRHRRPVSRTLATSFTWTSQRRARAWAAASRLRSWTRRWISLMRRRSSTRARCCWGQVHVHLIQVGWSLKEPDSLKVEILPLCSNQGVRVLNFLEMQECTPIPGWNGQWEWKQFHIFLNNSHLQF